MPNPLASPKSSDRDALRDLEQHPGYVLLMERLREQVNTQYNAILNVTDSHDWRSCAGQINCLRNILGHDTTPSLREQMIEELTAELRDFEAGDEAHRKADAAFGYER